MACTRTRYRATPTWTAPQLADLFKTGFTEAGYMVADWFDSFTNSSVENRILRVVHDSTKTYGTTFYWWMFTTNGCHVHVATGWDPVAHVPTGTLYLDYFSTATNSSFNHLQMFSASNASTIDLYRYTSQADPNQSFFLIQQGATRRVFTIVSAAKQLQPWINLDRGCFSGYTSFWSGTSNTAGLCGWAFGPLLRRGIIRGSGLRGVTSAGDYRGNNSELQLGYAAAGNASGGGNIPGFSGPYIYLPVGHSNTNDAYPVNSNPIFHSLSFTPYITGNMGPDFGITFHYDTNTFSPLDEFAAGSEIWDILDFTPNSSSVTGASPLFVAKMSPA